MASDSDPHFGVYFIQLYLPISSRSPLIMGLMASPLPGALFFGCHGSSRSNPFEYDTTHFSCFLFEWSH
jgi:hypothetical protein